MSQPHKEKILFEIGLAAEFWDKPPHATISIDGVNHWHDDVLAPIANPLVVRFWNEFVFPSTHTLSLTRTGKTPDQTQIFHDGSLKDQMLRLMSVRIDGIDIQNIVWHRSWFEPEYPVEWAQQQQDAGVVLETHVRGETWLGHNGTWRMDFTSPFYKFLIDLM